MKSENKNMMKGKLNIALCGNRREHHNTGRKT